MSDEESRPLTDHAIKCIGRARAASAEDIDRLLAIIGALKAKLSVETDRAIKLAGQIVAVRKERDALKEVEGRLETLGAEYIREKERAGRLAAALELLWVADTATRESYIDEPDENLYQGASELRDAWRAVREARKGDAK